MARLELNSDQNPKNGNYFASDWILELGTFLIKKAGEDSLPTGQYQAALYSTLQLISVEPLPRYGGFHAHCLCCVLSLLGLFGHDDHPLDHRID